jgi:hypothetical protein
VPFEVERDAVHALPLPTGLLRPIVEEVAEVGVAARAAHLGAHHPVGALPDELDSLRPLLCNCLDQKGGKVTQRTTGALVK